MQLLEQKGHNAIWIGEKVQMAGTKGEEGKERLMGARHVEPKNDSSRAQRPGMVKEGRK